jgi:hypothetical protein
MGVDVKGNGAAQKMHGRNQSRQSQKMIAVVVRDKNVPYFLVFCFVPAELKLSSFSAIDEEIVTIVFKKLGGRPMF